MNLEEKLDILNKLGNQLQGLINTYNKGDNYFQLIFQQQQQKNPWISEEFSSLALNSLITKLSTNFFSEKAKNIIESQRPREIGLVINRNYPLAGVYELLFTFISGHKIFVKEEDNKQILLRTIVEVLCKIEPKVKGLIYFAPVFPKTIDAWIIHKNQESENSALFQYFKQKNCLFISHDRVAVTLNGTETEVDFNCLAGLIFIFWGFHPDNVRKLFIPQGFSLDKLFQAMEQYSYVYNHNRYANNYDYHKSVYLMDSKPFLDNGFIMLVKSKSANLPIGCLAFEEYEKINSAKGLLSGNMSNFRQSEEIIIPGDSISSITYNTEIPMVINFLNQLL
jgi:hypothetical protein